MKALFVITFYFLIVTVAQANLSSKIINAKDYGLKEGIDNTSALIKALEVCKEQKAEKLIIPNGVYDIYPDKAYEMYRHIPNNDDGLKRIVFLLHGFNDFEIDGQGSKFICHDYMIPFDIESSNNVTLRDFSIDWAMPFFFQAEVIAVHSEDNSFDIKVLDECNYEIHGEELIFTNKKEGKGGWLQMAPPAQEAVRWEQNINWNIWFDPNTKAPVFNVETQTRLHTWNQELNKPATAREIGENTIRLYNATNTLPQTGWVIVIKGKLQKNRLSPAIHVTQSKDLFVKDVTVHHSSGIALIADRTENVSLKGYNVLLPHDTERLVSTTADATHFLNCKGLIEFENCVFENMLDDAANVHGAYVDVHDAIDDYSIGMTRGHSQQQGIVFADIGDTIKLLNRNNLEPYATLTVKSVKNVNSFYFEITFNEKITGILQDETIADNISWQPDVVMRNCTVRNNRARSILISTLGNVLIENNHFLRCTYAGIVIAGNYDFWYESGPVQNVIIRKNWFEDLGLAGGNAPIIDIAGNISKEVNPPFFFHKNIVVENNVINTFSRILVRARSLENFRFSGNTIERSKNYPVVTSLDGPSFIFDRCKDIVIKDNNYKWGNSATISAEKTTELSSRNNKKIQKLEL